MHGNGIMPCSVAQLYTAFHTLLERPLCNETAMVVATFTYPSADAQAQLAVGNVLCHPEWPVPLATRLTARLVVLDVAVPILRGQQVPSPNPSLDALSLRCTPRDHVRIAFWLLRPPHVPAHTPACDAVCGRIFALLNAAGGAMALV